MTMYKNTLIYLVNIIRTIWCIRLSSHWSIILLLVSNSELCFCELSSTLDIQFDCTHCFLPNSNHSWANIHCIQKPHNWLHKHNCVIMFTGNQKSVTIADFCVAHWQGTHTQFYRWPTRRSDSSWNPAGFVFIRGDPRYINNVCVCMPRFAETTNTHASFDRYNWRPLRRRQRLRETTSDDDGFWAWSLTRW